MMPKWSKVICEIPAPLAGFCRMANRYLYGRSDKLKFQKHHRSTDVFVVGHPKSGNTWLAYMIAIAQCKDYEHTITLSNLANFIPFIHGRDSSIIRYQYLLDPRIFRNEFPVYPDLYPRTIYIVRDPRAVLISYYHHYRTVTSGTGMNLQSFVQQYLSQGCIRSFNPELVRWDKQVLEWTKRMQSQQVMIIKYEEMVQDRRKVLEEVVQFAGISCTAQDIELAVERGSFEAMRLDEEQHGAESYPGDAGRRGRFIRRGKVNGWKEELTPALANLIVNEFSEAMKAIGYIL